MQMTQELAVGRRGRSTQSRSGSTAGHGRVDSGRGGRIASGGSLESRGPATEERVETFVERLTHYDLVLVRDDYALELRDAPAFRPQIDGLHVDQ